MTNEHKKRDIPWGQLMSILFVLALGFGGAGWALWLYVTGRGEDALLVALVTMGVTRFLAGRLVLQALNPETRSAGDERHVGPP